MIPDQEEKFEAVYKSLTEKATEQLLFNTFLKMYPEAWKQLKITFSKFKRSKQFGKPFLYQDQRNHFVKVSEFG